MELVNVLKHFKLNLLIKEHLENVQTEAILIHSQGVFFKYLTSVWFLFWM
jgi:hypothetical protein